MVAHADFSDQCLERSPMAPLAHHEINEVGISLQKPREGTDYHVVAFPRDEPADR